MGVTAMLLAAGASHRFGSADKLLADTGDGIAVVARVSRALDVAGVDDIIVVVRPGADALRQRIREAGLSRDVRFVVNARAEQGLASSIVAGLAEVRGSARGLLVTPADMAGLTRPTVERLLAAFAADGCDRIAYAALPDGRQRHPVVWPRRLWPRLAVLTGDGGGKAVIGEDEAHRGAVAVRVADAGELADIDTPQDIEAFRKQRSV